MQMEVRQIVGDPSEGDQETLVIAGILSNLSNHARFCARSGTCPGHCRASADGPPDRNTSR